jgi:hypothetical protein
MIVLSDRIKETSHSVGTATFVLEGAAPGFSAFGDFYSTGAVVYYAITDGSDYEVGSGQYISDGTNKITRFPFDSSDSDGLVTFGGGLKEVFVTYPGKYSVFTAAGIGTYQEPAMSGLAFWGSRQILDYNSNLVWNTADSKLGILTNNPQYALDIGGAEADSIIRSSGMIVGDSGVMFSGVSATGGRQIEPFLRTLLDNDTGTDAVFTLSGIVNESLLFQKQIKGSVFSGPPSGCTPSLCSPDYPTFRYLVLEDIPDLSTLYTRQAGDGVAGNVPFYKTSGVHEFDPYFTWKKDTNRLGLMVTDPQYTLDIDGTAGISGAVQVSGIATFGNTLNVSGNAIFDSNVGIGLDSPESPLHIRETAALLDSTYLEMLRLEVTDSGYGNDMVAGHGPGITFYVGETPGAVGSDWGGTIAVIKENDEDVFSDAAMVFHTSTDDQTPSNAREKMRITSLGLVGIGTTNPQAQLHVAESGMFGSGVRITENLLVSGNVYASGDAIIDGNLTVHGTLDAHVADFKVTADTMTFGDTSADNVIFNASTASIPNNLHFSAGNISLSNSLIVGQNVSVTGNLNTKGNASVTGNLDVSGVSTFDGHVGFTSNAPVVMSGTLGVSGAAQFDNTINVSGDVTLGNDLWVTNDATVSGVLNSSGTFNASGNAFFGADATFGGALNTNGILNVNNTLNATGALNVSGIATFGNALNASGNAAFGGSTTFGSDVIFNTSTVDVPNGLIFNGGNVGISGILKASGDVHVSGNVGIGTSSPSQLLSILGTSAQLRIATPTTATDPSLFLSGGTDTTSVIEGLKIWYDYSSGASYIDNLINDAAGDLYIRTRTADTPVNAITIESAGNVGIGTTTPDAKFHVAGSVGIVGNTVASGTLGVSGLATLNGGLDTYSGGISSNTIINASGYMVVPGYTDEDAVIAAWPPSTPHSGILVVGGTSLMWCDGTNWLSGVLA